MLAGVRGIAAMAESLVPRVYLAQVGLSLASPQPFGVLVLTPDASMMHFLFASTIA